MISLSECAVCFSVSPRRQSLQRRLFRAQGLAVPPVSKPFRVERPTHGGQPAYYSALACNYIEALFAAYRAGLPYLLIYEDDAAPCIDPQGRLDSILARHPLPQDCAALCLGDLNGVSCVRGRETLLLPACSPVYTPLEPGRAENKGSHALVVFRHGMLPYAQAIMENGVTDLAISRVCRYCKGRAYGLFRSPLFAQHRFDQNGAASLPYRTPELYAGDAQGLLRDFPLCSSLTRLSLSAPVRRVFILSNAPGKDISRLGLRGDDVVVLLNKAVDLDALPKVRKVLLGRMNAKAPGSWFIPRGQEEALAEHFEDFLLPTDAELSRERAWFRRYREETGAIPTTGWVAWQLLREDFPGAEVNLVDFDPAGDVGSFKWPLHGWDHEAKAYEEAGATIIVTR